MSSDKTTISVITGNRIAHPLLISLANIDSEVRSKASNHLFSLLALIPIPRYSHPKREVNGVCENRLYHQSLDIVLKPLKKAAQVGVMMADPVGQLRFCYTPCASFIVDTPEAALIACVGGGGKTSPFTTASYQSYGDPYRHPSRTASLTLETISGIDVAADDLESYWQAAQKARTNGVVAPFWRDWRWAEPCEFLTPERLHHWDKMFFDHDLKWAKRAAGVHELDYRISLLQRRVGFRHFPEGVSALKQVTGKTHRDIQSILITSIAGAVARHFLVALRALMDVRYSGKASRFTEASSARIQLALNEFHDHKCEVMNAGARANPKGEPIENWYIPKLEFMQSIVPSITASGPVSQWSADVTEHAHIALIKEPARAGNNKDYERQIVRHLDMLERLRNFDLMTAIKEANVIFRTEEEHRTDAEGAEDMDDLDTEAMELDFDDPPVEEAKSTLMSSSAQLVAHLGSGSKFGGAKRRKADLFHQSLLTSRNPDSLLPYRTFTNDFGCTAFHLIRDPDQHTLNWDEATAKFYLPDLVGAFKDYMGRLRQGTRTFTIGGRRANRSQEELPFSHIKIWSKFVLQGKQYFNNDLVTDPCTIHACPPSQTWTYGRQDCAVMNVDPNKCWPQSSMNGRLTSLVLLLATQIIVGHSVVAVKIIFTPVQPRKPAKPIPGTHQFYAYCERFDVVPQETPPQKYAHLPLFSAWDNHTPDYFTGCYVLKRARRNNGEPFGDIIPLAQFRAFADLAAHIRGKANRHLSSSTSFHFNDEFLFNKYRNDEIYHTLEHTDTRS